MNKRVKRVKSGPECPSCGASVRKSLIIGGMHLCSSCRSELTEQVPVKDGNPVVCFGCGETFTNFLEITRKTTDRKPAGKFIREITVDETILTCPKCNIEHARTGGNLRESFREKTISK